MEALEKIRKYEINSYFGEDSLKNLKGYVISVTYYTPKNDSCLLYISSYFLQTKCKQYLHSIFKL